MSLTFPLAGPTYPLYTGIGISSDVPSLLPISLGGHAYLADSTRIRRETIDVLRPAIDTAGQPGQHSLSTAGVWSYIGNDWRHGTGQQNLDSNNANVRRYRTSKGVDPWTREQLTLQPDTHRIKSAAKTPLKLCSIDNELWAGGEDYLERSTNATASSPTWTSVTIGVTNDVLSLATDGGRVYVALGAGGIRRAAKGGSSLASFSTYAATLVAFANGRLFAAKSGELVEINGSGAASSALWSGSLGGDGEVVSVIGTPRGVLVGYNTLDRGEVMFIGLNETTGALATPLFAGELNKGETFHQLAYYQDTVLAATSRGLRLGVLGTDGRSIAFGPVIAFGTCAGVAAWGQFAWFVWNNYDTVSHGLGRADLATFTEPFVPAYASDLMHPQATGLITDLVTHRGQPVYAVAGDGVHTRHPTRLVPTGTLESGRLRFGTFENKVVVGASVRHAPLDGTISIAICDETGTETTLGTADTAASVGPATEFTGGGLSGETLEVCITLARASTDSLGPELRRWTVRAMNVPRRTDAIELPLIVRSRVMAGPDATHPVSYDPLAEWRFLKALEAERTIVTLRMGDHAESCIVDKIALEPERWTDGHRWLEGQILVRLLTVNPENN